MNQSEFLAMVDDRLSDGRHYPTLDDYGAALETLKRQEQEASPAREDYERLREQALSLQRAVARETQRAQEVKQARAVVGPVSSGHTLNIHSGAMAVLRARESEQRALRQMQPPPTPKRYRVYLNIPPDRMWHEMAGQTFDDVSIAQQFVTQIRRHQSHVHINVCDSTTGAVIE